MNKAKYSVEKMCLLLKVSKSAYYDWLRRNDLYLDGKSEKLKAIVDKLFQKSKRTYGSPRIAQMLQDSGMQVSKSTVARIMQSLGIQARPRRKYVHTTDSDHDYKVFDNKLNRNFESRAVNEKWVSDITYIATQQGWTYLTIIMDLADRMIVGWHLSKKLTASQTSVSALEVALKRRKRKSDRKLLLHSDRGVQYCCTEFRQRLKKAKQIEQSMSRKGNCWDNAPAESFFKTLKVEWTNKYRYKNIDQARTSIFDYIERWYNTKRKHSGINYMTPLEKHYFLTRTAA